MWTILDVPWLRRLFIAASVIIFISGTIIIIIFSMVYFDAAGVGQAPLSSATERSIGKQSLLRGAQETYSAR